MLLPSIVSCFECDKTQKILVSQNETINIANFTKSVYKIGRTCFELRDESKKELFVVINSQNVKKQIHCKISYTFYIIGSNNNININPKGCDIENGISITLQLAAILKGVKKFGSIFMPISKFLLGNSPPLQAPSFQLIFTSIIAAFLCKIRDIFN